MGKSHPRTSLVSFPERGDGTHQAWWGRGRPVVKSTRVTTTCLHLGPEPSLASALTLIPPRGNNANFSSSVLTEPSSPCHREKVHVAAVLPQPKTAALARKLWGHRVLMRTSDLAEVTPSDGRTKPNPGFLQGTLGPCKTPNSTIFPGGTNKTIYFPQPEHNCHSVLSPKGMGMSSRRQATCPSRKA